MTGERVCWGAGVWSVIRESEFDGCGSVREGGACLAGVLSAGPRESSETWVVGGWPLVTRERVCWGAGVWSVIGESGISEFDGCGSVRDGGACLAGVLTAGPCAAREYMSVFEEKLNSSVLASMGLTALPLSLWEEVGGAM